MLEGLAAPYARQRDLSLGSGPNRAGAVAFRKATIRIDDHACDRLAAIHGERVVGGLDPGFRWDDHVTRRPILECDPHRRRQHELTAIADVRALGGITVDIGDAIRREIEGPAVEEPPAPEPGEILAALAVDGPEEVRRLWMFVRPVANELAERRVEPLRPQDVFAQENESEGCFEIADWVAIGDRYRVRARHNRWRVRVGDQGGDLVGGCPVARSELLIALGPIDAAVEGVGLIDIDEGVEALVHPCIGHPDQ
jgi:hypothetical protein